MENEKHAIIFNALAEVLGPENVSDDTAVNEAYTRDFLPPGLLDPMRPEFVALPANTREVQAIYRLANRYQFPCIPVGSNLWSACTKATRPFTVLIDPKRMDKVLEVDEKNMFAIIEPYATNAQVHAEAMQRGLCCGTPEAGGQASHLAGHVFQGFWGIGHRTGMGYRNIQGFEWILPNGEFLRVGSLSSPNCGPFWGAGPGPDLRGMLRGYLGTMGGFGMVTKMAVKLHPWPGPKAFPCEGIVPNQISVLPQERFKWVLFTYPTIDEAVEGMYEVGRAEIGGNCHKWPTDYLNWWWAKSGEEYWETWKAEYFQKNMKNVVGVCLWGLTSERQVQYEKRVIMDIIEETGGTLISEEAYEKWVPSTANNWIRDTDGPRMMQPSGAFALFTVTPDTLNVALAACKRGWEFMDRYSPPVLDCDHSDWIASHEFCRFAIGETDFPFEKDMEESKAVMGALMAMFQDGVQKKVEDGTGIAMGAPYHAMAGPAFYNYDKYLRGLKQAIDPKNVANPPQPIPVE